MFILVFFEDVENDHCVACEDKTKRRFILNPDSDLVDHFFNVRFQVVEIKDLFDVCLDFHFESRTWFLLRHLYAISTAEAEMDG